MDTLSIDVRIEDFICRIPAMFPYLEWNGDGTVDTHKATDSPDGSYGKIVDNMMIPQGITLTNYVQIPETDVPATYVWGDANTISLSEDASFVFSTNASSYLRRVIWYFYEQTDTEYPDAEEVEELPSYVTDDDPEQCKMLASEGELEIDCEQEPLYYYYEKRGRYAYYKREDIIKPCTTYSYKTIIYNYYKYKDIVGSNSPFVKFVEGGIGLVNVDRRLLNLEDETKYSEVPEHIYLSQVRKMLSVYRQYKTASEIYEMHYLANGWTDTTLAEKAKKYVRMGGNNMTNWLGQLLQKAYDVANEYLCHANNKDFPVRFNVGIMLNTKTDIVGLETPYVNEFIPGKRYYDGDLLTYEGKTYLCVLDKFKDGGNNYQYVLKSGNLLELGNAEYITIPEEHISYVYCVEDVPNASTTFVCCNDDYYKWDYDTSAFVQIDVVTYCTGMKNEGDDRIVFDTQHFVPLNEIDGYDEWYDEENLDGEKYRFFVDMEYLPSVRISDYVRMNNSIFVWDYTNSEYIPMEEGDESYMITERTNSKLRDVRIFREYVNPFGVAEEPGLNEDWLYFYKVNNITGTIIETDENGNIVRDGDDYTYGEYCYDLHAYGNVITSISYNATDNTVTIQYAMGIHLKAKNGTTVEDVDGNQIHHYSDLEFDEDSKDGVLYTETYACIGDSIASLGSDFEAYVNGDIQVLSAHQYEKFPFRTIPVATLGGIMNVEGVGIASIPAENGLLHSNVVREDWMNGLWHQPKVKSSILIDRGNGASFERHIRLGEIHTMEDLENYQNGGFYIISEN